MSDIVFEEYDVSGTREIALILSVTSISEGEFIVFYAGEENSSNNTFELLAQVLIYTGSDVLASASFLMADISSEGGFSSLPIFSTYVPGSNVVLVTVEGEIFSVLYDGNTIEVADSAYFGVSGSKLISDGDDGFMEATDAYYQAGTVTTDGTLTIGTEAYVSDGFSMKGHLSFDISAGKYLHVFVGINAVGEEAYRARVISVSGVTCTLGSRYTLSHPSLPESYNNNYVLSNNLYAPADSKSICFCNSSVTPDYENFAFTLEVSGMGVSFGAPTTIDGDFGNVVSCAVGGGAKYAFLQEGGVAEMFIPLSVGEFTEISTLETDESFSAAVFFFFFVGMFAIANQTHPGSTNITVLIATADGVSFWGSHSMQAERSYGVTKLGRIKVTPGTPGISAIAGTRRIPGTPAYTSVVDGSEVHCAEKHSTSWAKIPTPTHAGISPLVDNRSAVMPSPVQCNRIKTTKTTNHPYVPGTPGTRGTPGTPGTPGMVERYFVDGWNSWSISRHDIQRGTYIDFTVPKGTRGSLLSLGIQYMTGGSTADFSHSIIAEVSGIMVMEYGKKVATLTSIRRTGDSIRMYRQEDNSVVATVTSGTDTYVYMFDNLAHEISTVDMFIYTNLYTRDDLISDAGYNFGTVSFGKA